MNTHVASLANDAVSSSLQVAHWPREARRVARLLSQLRGGSLTVQWPDGEETEALVIATISAVALALLLAQSKWLERALLPFAIILQVTPIIAIVPLMVRLIGANFTARVLVTVIISIFPIVSNTLFGIQSVHPSLHDLFRLQRATRWVALTKLQLPAASPSIFTGLRVSAGLAVIGAIVGDFFFTKGDPGLGQLITFFFLNNLSGPMFITALFATGLGLMLFIGFGVLNRLVIGRWHESVSR